MTGERKPSSPSATAATAALSLRHLRRTDSSESLWVAFVVARGVVPSCYKSSVRRPNVAVAGVPKDKNLGEPATSKSLKRMQLSQPLLSKSQDSVFPLLEERGFPADGIGGRVGACPRSWRLEICAAHALCEGGGDVVSVVTLLVGGVAQAFHGDQVVELRVQLAVQQVEGKEEDRKGQVEVEEEKRLKEVRSWMTMEMFMTRLRS